ncbi:MAG: hypothetical protein S4CHLAM123_02310 [Chlamydiales bacterium]|nr:hypothetical protein [Chlamydiales bacterium]
MEPAPIPKRAAGTKLEYSDSAIGGLIPTASKRIMSVTRMISNSAIVVTRFKGESEAQNDFSKRILLQAAIDLI